MWASIATNRLQAQSAACRYTTVEEKHKHLTFQTKLRLKMAATQSIGTNDSTAQ